jgi:hypothetical protein
MSDNPCATIEQPTPKTGIGDVTGMVLYDLTKRRMQGIEQYGTPLMTHNGRDALVDAYQEALDLCLYLRQAIAERDDSPNPSTEPVK